MKLKTKHMVKALPLTLLLVIFLHAVQLAHAADASIMFSNPIDKQNISLVINTSTAAEAYTVEAIKDELSCRYIPTGKYGYFQVNDQTITSTDNNLILELTFFDEGNGFFYFHYNGITGNYQKITINKTNTNTWMTLKVSIRDASFKNAQNNSADFRISGPAYIRQVALSKGELIPGNEQVPTTQGSAYSEFKGKSVAGYQAWFRASNDNSGWVHWPNGSQARPAPGNSSFEIYPDMTDYDESARYLTDFANFGNGEQATLFNSPEVINTHFGWMKKHGIDGVALQRFIGDTPYPIIYSEKAVPIQVKKAAEANQKIFYICYDMSSGKDETAWVESIKFDWVYNIEQTMALTSSPAYATVNNKPVVQIWGPGFTTRVGDAAKTIELISFLKSRGCYVIGGVPTGWRNEERDSKPNFLSAYKSYDMVSPWTPGRYRDISGIITHANSYWIPDKNYCIANGIDYLPVLFPGFAWSTWHSGAPNQTPRLKGDFLWQQAHQIKSADIKQMYFAMFDEYDEGTAIMKGATDWSNIPTNQYFLTYSADGTWLSSDFYLRLAGSATSMLKSNAPFSSTIPIPYSEGPVYYRNSFEKRDHSYREVDNGPYISGTFNIDPCFYNPQTQINTNTSNSSCTIVNNANEAKSGLYYVNFTGQPTSNTTSKYSYKIADVKIPVTENLQLSFYKKTLTSLGQYANVDLIFKSGKQLSQLPSYRNNFGTSMNPSFAIGNVNNGWENIVCLIGTGELLGDEIKEIVIKYDHPANSGNFQAFFDEIILATNIPLYIPDTVVQNPISVKKIRASNKIIYFDSFEANSLLQIINIRGQVIYLGALTSNSLYVNYPDGIYYISVINRDYVFFEKIKL